MCPLKHPSTPTPSPIPIRDAFCACACHVHHRRVSQHIVYRGTNEVEKELFPPFSYLFLLLAVGPKSFSSVPHDFLPLHLLSVLFAHFGVLFRMILIQLPQCRIMFMPQLFRHPLHPPRNLLVDPLP